VGAGTGSSQTPATNGARDYRNLIHAGEERARQPCDRGTALTAQAAVEALVQVFSGARR
jgi:hypothetical protein